MRPSAIALAIAVCSACGSGTDAPTQPSYVAPSLPVANIVQTGELYLYAYIVGEWAGVAQNLGEGCATSVRWLVKETGNSTNSGEGSLSDSRKVRPQEEFIFTTRVGIYSSTPSRSFDVSFSWDNVAC